ncbi:MAG TPA: esterase, partial [Methylomirabilota bacterium]|nr:esterase [Methylomirabilota bacterium]
MGTAWGTSALGPGARTGGAGGRMVALGSGVRVQLDVWGTALGSGDGGMGVGGGGSGRMTVGGAGGDGA